MRRFRSLAAAIALGPLVAVLLTAPVVSATSVEDAEDEVARLGREVEIAAEQYNEAQARLGPVGEQLAAARTREADQQRLVATLRADMTTFAIEVFKHGRPDPSLAVLMSEDPVALVENAAVVEALARTQGTTLEDYEAALAQLAVDRETTAATLAEVEALEQQRAAARADVEARLAGAQDVLARAQRIQAERAAAALAASRARAAQEAAAAAAAAAPAGGGVSPAAPAATPVTSDGSGGALTCGSVETTAPTARVAAVLEFACAQLGKPYQWAADGPGSYDCSGFTMTSWAQGGVSLPHSSKMQYSAGTRVARSELQPGDLVFFYSPISHVGIYLGNDMMIAAPSTGDVVKVQRMYSPYTGAVRL